MTTFNRCFSSTLSETTRRHKNGAFIHVAVTLRCVDMPPRQILMDLCPEGERFFTEFWAISAFGATTTSPGAG